MASLQAFKLPGIQNTIIFPQAPAVALESMAAESISSKLSRVNRVANPSIVLLKKGVMVSTVMSSGERPDTDAPNGVRAANSP